MDTANLILHKKRFQNLTVDELYELLRVRSEVFVVEQDCVYQDMDGDDQASIHLWLTEGDRVVALCRVCPAGTHMEEVSIGRVITTDRGKGYGKRIMEEGIKAAREYFGADRIDIEAQEYARGFYEQVGFRQSSHPFILDGIPHIRMTWSAGNLAIVKLSDRKDLKDRAADWFSSKWSVPKEAYLESIEDSFTAVVPSWYLCLDGDRIVAGMGVIENDFHNRKDLTPNVCAVYTEEAYRRRGIAGKMLGHVCGDMAAHGIDTLYLLTDHTGFYERYGWEYYCMVQGDGEDKPSRMYIHKPE